MNQDPKGAQEPVFALRFSDVRWESTDALLLLALCATALVSLLPLWPEAFLAYYDNAAHVAELHPHGYARGWSELAFCGYPLKLLHSPLWYTLVRWLVALGLPLLPLYFAMLVVGVAGPPLALYVIFRRRTSPFWAGVAGCLLMSLPTNLYGTGSVTGGMWTFGICNALLLLYIDRLLRSRRAPLDLVWEIGLLALIGLTHFFTLLTTVLIFLLVMGLKWFQKKLTWRMCLVHIMASLVAALIAALYWLPWLLTMQVRFQGQQFLSPGQLLMRLVIPTDLMRLLNYGMSTRSLRWELWFLDALPMLLLFGLASLSWRQWRALPSREERLMPQLGVLSAGFLVVLLLLGSLFGNSLLGPLPWRFVTHIQLAMGLTLLAWSHHPLVKRKISQKGTIALALGMVVWGGVMCLPLQSFADRIQHLPALQRTWTWLQKNHKPEWGRIYVQDPFFTPGAPRGLQRGHITSLTSWKTGLPQVGAYYGGHPFATDRWLRSELGAFFGRRKPAAGWVAGGLAFANVGVLLTLSPHMAHTLRRFGPFQPLFQDGPFVVWRYTQQARRWTLSYTPALKAHTLSFAPGRLKLVITSPGLNDAKHRLLVKVGWHRWWQLKGPKAARLIKDPATHLMLLTHLPKGRHTYELQWRPSLWPSWLSLFGCSLLLALVLGLWRLSWLREEVQRWQSLPSYTSNEAHQGEGRKSL